jgi:hypothetical protein
MGLSLHRGPVAPRSYRTKGLPWVYLEVEASLEAQLAHVHYPSWSPRCMGQKCGAGTAFN